jgi:hypothetical protein
MTTPDPLTPAEHRAKAESCLRQLQTLGPGSLAWHGLAQAAIAHVLVAIAGYLEPPAEPDIPGLPLGWRVRTRSRQGRDGEERWGYVLTAPDRAPVTSPYKFGSSVAALAAGLRDPSIPQDTEGNGTGEPS